jgi:hypothetical protein
MGVFSPFPFALIRIVHPSLLLGERTWLTSVFISVYTFLCVQLTLVKAYFYPIMQVGC